MALNIYDIDDWASGTSYQKNDIVKYNNLFYYALRDITSSTTAPDNDPTNFGGRALDSNDGNMKYEFIWIPSVPFEPNHNPLVIETKFGGGYSQRTKGIIYNNLLDISLNFDGRNLREYRAIIHFLNLHAGVNSFLFNAPAPYGSNIKKVYICQEYPGVCNFYDNYSIRARFVEVPA